MNLPLALQAFLLCFICAIVADSSLVDPHGGGTVAKEGGAPRAVGDVLAPNQKWRNNDNSAVLMIDKVNKINSTFAGSYAIIRDDIRNSEFPFRGEFDPQGITIGWVVSYWNDQVNDHALGAWAGYVKSLPDKNPEWMMTTTRIIAHEDNSNTTTGFDLFVLESK